MLVSITTIAYNQPESLLEMVESAVNSTVEEIQFHLFLHSKMKSVEEACEYIRETYNCVYWPIRKNVGVARSWNEGLLASSESDIHMLVNDDIKFGRGDIDRMIDLALESDNAWGIFCSGTNSSLGQVIDHGMSCIIITRQAMKVVGMFDENFFPAYNEDIDYAHRAKLAGLDKVIAKANVHHIGSAAIKASSVLRRQNHVTHGLNDEYWKQKWGAEKPAIKYERPFNFANFHPYFIPAEMRHAPYPGFNRTDREIVVI